MRTRRPHRFRVGDVLLADKWCGLVLELLAGESRYRFLVLEHSSGDFIGGAHEEWMDEDMYDALHLRSARDA